MPAIQEMQIEEHKLVALSRNPAAPGQPIILLHGIGNSIHFWNTDAVFGAHGPSYALTLPGHHPAAWPQNFRQDQLTAESMARVLSAAIRRLVGSRSAILVGASTGGFAALAIAAHAPEIAGRVVCISGFAQGRWTGNLGMMQQFAQSGPVGTLLFKGMYAFLRSSRATWRWGWSSLAADKRAFHAYPDLEMLIDSTYRDAQELDLDAMALYYRVMRAADISPLLARIAAPTLVMAGDRDPTVPPAQAQLIAHHVRRAELAIIQGAGHCLFAERPSEYKRILDDWLYKTSV